MVRFFVCILALVFVLPLEAKKKKKNDFQAWDIYLSQNIFQPAFTFFQFPQDPFPAVLFDKNNFNGQGDAVPFKLFQHTPEGIALSYSEDGIVWAFKALVIADPNAFRPILFYDKAGFGGSSFHYKIWYWTNNSSPTPPQLTMKFSQSPDGLNWEAPIDTTQDTVSFLSDVTVSSTPFHQFFGFGTVIFNPNATSTAGEPFTFPYVVFYDAGAADSFNYKQAVALAYSSDGINWTRFGSEPVLIPSGKSKDWDGKYIYRAAVVKGPAIQGAIEITSPFEIFYSGSSGKGGFGEVKFNGIGAATSTDGIHWERDKANPIFPDTPLTYPLVFIFLPFPYGGGSYLYSLPSTSIVE